MKPQQSYDEALETLRRLDPEDRKRAFAQLKREREDKDLDYFAVERWNGAFSRSLALPQGVDRERIEASFRNGVLEVHLPKTQDTKSKSIEIRAA